MIADRRRDTGAHDQARLAKMEKRDPRHGVEATSMRCPRIPIAWRTMKRPMPRLSRRAGSRRVLAGVTATEENAATGLCVLDGVATQVAQNSTEKQRIALNRGAGRDRTNADSLC